MGDLAACFGGKQLAIPKGKKCQPKEQHEFTIKGIKIIASSYKNAIKNFNHSKK